MVLVWILLSTFLMSLISWVGLVIVYINKEAMDKIKKPLIAFAAGSLFGGAFFHMIPESLNKVGIHTEYFIWLVGGFSLFFLLEQVINWHYYHHYNRENTQSKENKIDHIHHGEEINASRNTDGEEAPKESFTYLILIADGLHNFIGGIAIGSSFLISVDVGIITWIAAAAHEIPQELGDFGILVHGGWKKKKALFMNFLSALTIIPGGLLVYYSSQSINIGLMLVFAAGNFIYLSASDLIPEITHGQAHIKKKEGIESNEIIKKGIQYFIFFVIGLL